MSRTYDSMLVLHGFTFDQFSEQNRPWLCGDDHDHEPAYIFCPEVFQFPDGSSHVKIACRLDGHVLIVASPNDERELMEIILAKDALDRMGFIGVDLAMPYWLGSRQDRVCDHGEPLTTKVYADLINSCYFRRVHIWHPHSLVTPALIDGAVVHEGIAKEVIARWSRDNMLLVAPDAGAAKMTFDLSKYAGVPMVSAEKVRDMRTGKILNFALHAGHEDIEGKDVFVVDDCISNGGTFLGLLTKIREQLPRTVQLVVTHADHATGVMNMVGPGKFDHVYISNSRTWTNKISRSGPKISVIELNFKM